METTFKILISFTLLVNICQASACVRNCRCDSRNNVYCIENSWTFVPYGIPVETRSLNMYRNNITNGPTTNANLERLINLKKLDMHQNDLKSFPIGLPNSLELIYFQKNDIKYIGRNSLHGLSNLNELHLDENNITNKGLSSVAFKDATRLMELVLTNNLLTAVPEGLPVSLRVLRLDNNLVQRVTVSALQPLTRLIRLDLSGNSIIQNFVEPSAFLGLHRLRTLDVSANRLTQIPKGLPDNLDELLLSKNSIEFVYSTSSDDGSPTAHGSLSGLTMLTKLDLSSNKLQSVEYGAFDGQQRLRTCELQNNPWQCDCYLTYLKRWLSSTTTTLSSERNTRCSTPQAFSGVTLRNIDQEVLNCDIREAGAFRISDVTSNSAILSWSNSTETPDPAFVNIRVMSGKMSCSNCSFSDDPTNGVLTVLRGAASDWLSTYSIVNVAGNMYKINGLEPNRHYAVCLLDSTQDPKLVTTDQCQDFWLKEPPTTSAPNSQVDPKSNKLPLWLIVLCCVLAVLLLLALIAVVICRRRSREKPVLGAGNMYTAPRLTNSRHNRQEYYFPDSYLPGFTQNSATQRSDRTYAEVGPGGNDAAIDAMREFDVTLMVKPNDATAPKRLHMTQDSLSSYSSRHDTISTNQTAADGSRGSPPPSYEPYDSIGHRSSESMTSRLRQDTDYVYDLLLQR
nr:leucine-rich repeat transmembrane protein FLRT3-like isoform X1 [Ciona intestinalis]|eukprot:XP_002120213.1 leucine-rich repeat transmembrane protein FLRT3-like isoform X1 [Ciona intestinalis]